MLALTFDPVNIELALLSICANVLVCVDITDPEPSYDVPDATVNGSALRNVCPVKFCNSKLATVIDGDPVAL
jgi:hypothetical protein